MIEKIKKHFKKIVIAILGIFTLTAAAATVLMVPQGGTGINSVTSGSYLKGAGTGALVERTPTEVRTDLNLVDSPVFTTQITTPLVLGGTTTTADLTLQTTSGVGTSGADMHFLTGNAGGTEAMTILNSGYVGIGTPSPSTPLSVVGSVFPVGKFERTTAVTNFTQGALGMKVTTSGNMSDGFGPSFSYFIEDDLGVQNAIASISAVRDGADNTGAIAFKPYLAGSSSEAMRVKGNGNVGIGTTSPNEGLTLGDGVLSIFETTTPTATANYGKIYTKTDNSLYFQDGAGTEHEVVLKNGYAEAYTFDNAVATVIETANTPIGLRISTAGLLNNFTFDAGSTGAITAYSDYSGTVAGTVLITDVGHGLSTDDIITIRGSTNYNGVFQVTYVSVDTFYIVDTWVADDGASDWDQPGHVVYTGVTTELFSVVGQVSAAPAAACKLIWKLYVNDTPQNKSTVEREFAVNDLDVSSTSCIVSLSPGDITWLSVESDSTNDVTIKHGEFNAHRL